MLFRSSVLGQGTTVKAFFSLQHIDRPPLGDMAATLLTLVSTSPEIDFSYRHEVNGREFSFNTKDMRDILAGVALNNHQVLAWLKEYLTDNEKALYQD